MVRQSLKFHNPFEIVIDPMERLLLINFEKDPDEVYLGFEPQSFNDTIQGKGHLIIGWRVDGKVDVYHEPRLNLNPRKYDIAGKGLANMVQQKMQKAFLKITECGVQAHYLFRDILDREIILSIKENNKKKRKPFGLLAPMGDAAEKPSAMPLVFLHDFYFVRKKHTEIKVCIDGKQHQLDELPLPMDFSRMYFTRYSPQPLIVTLNPARDRAFALVAVEANAEKVSRGDYVYHLLRKNDKIFIKQIIRNNPVYPVSLFFNDPFPDVTSMENNESINGKFRIEAHPSVGHIMGEYSITKKDDNVRIIVIPSKGWKPRPTKFSLRFLYTAVKIFKRWPSTYKWTANIDLKENGACFMVSKWERINRN